MSHTTVTLTGTGVPHAAPGRAGAGVLVQYKDIALQFDAGRATVLRMIEAGVSPTQLSALFVTHYHSDHVVDLPDVVLTRWIQENLHKAGPLPIVTPHGSALRFVERMMDAYDDDIDIRQSHTSNTDFRLSVSSFTPQTTPTQVWSSPDGLVKVDAVAVHHEPVLDAVAYRVTTPDGSVVISGDTRVCDEVFELAADSDVLVHEACRTQALTENIKGTPFEKIFDYHSDSVLLGEFAERYGIAHVVLTHLIPSPRTPQDAAKFETDVRKGGYTGKVTVGEDLTSIVIGT
jgi:ribonuclease Z